MRLIYILLLFSCLVRNVACAQDTGIKLTPKHQQKLERMESGRKRLLKYYKFYKQDSARFAKKQDRHYRNVMDSIWRENWRREKMARHNAKKGLPTPIANATDTLDSSFSKWRAIFNDSTSTDSARRLAKDRMKALALEKIKRNPELQKTLQGQGMDMDSVSWGNLTSKFPGLDSLKGLLSASQTSSFSSISKGAEQSLSQSIGGAKPGNTPVADVQRYADRAQALKKDPRGAAQEALESLTKDQKALEKAQQSVGKLLNKYSSYSNSADLSDAVKRTSMKGKTFKEHLVIGGGINPVSYKPLSLDVSPSLGYKFTTRFNAGLSLSYRLTLGDSIKNDWYVSTTSTSLRLFTSYDVVRLFFAYAEWSKSQVKNPKNEPLSHRWDDNYLIGVGKKFLVHPKLYMTLTALYNLNNDDHNPVFLRRFQMRIGFQLSELATRKSKIYYDTR